MNDTASDSHRAELVMDLVAGALERDPAERAAYLRDACDGDELLRVEVQSLLDQEAGAERLLSAPVFASASGRIFGGEPGELQPGDILGECRVIRFLGEGGTGEVYLARDTRLERDVAVKLLKRQFDDGQLLRRFQHERRILAALTHPGIARLYGGAITPEGRSYLVMEYIEGERLDRYCDNAGLDVSGRLALFRKVCAAVGYAHQNLVVHRDLKPANIRVTTEGEPKLLDFGIAKLLETESSEPETNPTLTIQAMMTPEYASPEQLRGEAITTASDVYSLGVVLYEQLAGRRPYSVASRRPDELARAICEQEPARPSTVAARSARTESENAARGETPARLRRRLEGDLDNIVAMALRKEPARRYTSVGQFSDDIRRHCEGLPVLARRDTVGYRFGKFVQRNKTAVALSLLVLLALVSGLILATWQGYLAKQERDRARVAQARAEDERQQADAARQQAETAKKQADRINKFLERLLTSADPTKPGGKDMKVVDALDNASRNIDHDLAAEPEVLAQVHSTLGLAYVRLQLLPQSEEQSRAALAIFHRLHPARDAATTLETEKLGNILMLRRSYDEAEPLLRESLAWRRQHATDDGYALARTLQMLAAVFSDTDRPRDAEPLITEAMSLLRKIRGEDSTDYLMAVNLLGNTKLAEDDLDGALTQYRTAVATYEKISPGNILAVAPEINICKILFEQGKFAEEDADLERAEKDCRQSVGENNVYYGTILSHRALLDFARGDYGQAVLRARQALTSLTTTYPADSPMVVNTELALGVALTRTGQAAEAEPILRRTLSNSKNWKQSRGSHVLGNLETGLGECLLALKRYPDAEPLLLTGYKKLQERPAPHDTLTEAAVRRLHDLYIAWNKPAEAARFAGEGARKQDNQP